MANSTSYAKLMPGSVWTSADAPGKVVYNYDVAHAETKFFF
jgi:hypothetical protein